MKRLAYLTALFVLLVGCAKMTEEKRERKAHEYYTAALKAFDERDYKDAARNIEQALKFMDYLTPQQIENAKFLLGKSYYLDGDYVNAVVALEDYIFYYPKLPRTEEAYYMLVDSYIKVSPDPYRDQEYTWKAIDKAKEFLARFPGSSYAPKVQELIDVAYRKIAKHEYLIAKFYEDYGYTYSAAIRYRDLLINFPKHVSEEEVAYRYIRCLILADRQIKLEEEKVRKLLEKTKKKLDEVEKGEKAAVERRIKFLESEIERWREIGKRAKEQALEALKKYQEVYGRNLYYRKLEELVKEKGWKS